MSGTMKDALEKIIAGSSLDAKLRRVLSESLGALAERQMALEKELRGAIEVERSSEERLSVYDAHIKTALVDTSRICELSAWGFFDASPFAMDGPEAADLHPKIYFLKVPYADLNPILQTKFKATGGIEYELVPFYGYVENEEKLELLWRIYGFETPRPFSPWARRAVSVRFCQPFREEPDLNLSENGLENILLKDKALVWNVKIFKDQRVAQSDTIKDNAPAQAPELRLISRGGEEAYRYRYTAHDGDLGLWPLPQDISEGSLSPEVVDAVITDADVILTSKQKFSSLACEKIAFYPTGEPKDIVLLENKIEKWLLKTPATRGEFNRLLASFSTKEFAASFSSPGEKEVRRYEKGHRTTGNREHLPRHGEPFDVIFVCKNPDSAIFLEDYANWVLEELERRFPIFYWRGWF